MLITYLRMKRQVISFAGVPALPGSMRVCMINDAHMVFAGVCFDARFHTRSTCRRPRKIIL